MSNVETVKQIYAAFGRGDVPAILERLHPDVEWERGARDHGVPWLRPGRGRAHVEAFFRVLANDVSFASFVPHTLLEAGSTVVALIDLEATHRRTGIAVRESPQAHVWYFDAEGRVVAMRHLVDTIQHARAAAG